MILILVEQKGKKGPQCQNEEKKSNPKLEKLSHPCASKHHTWQHTEVSGRFFHLLRCGPHRMAQAEAKRLNRRRHWRSEQTQVTPSHLRIASDDDTEV